ncbi:hypothetical protein F0562_034716 [Nyssa sinensis]|uniref:Uncharacterized protein n=1 Tax=Nyssa sinensis TaxID=561372 RepID=A0A5J5AB86_9ASTE|nr:hypothetical protein F0562_034716 [Nyssa sinensis]
MAISAVVCQELQSYLDSQLAGTTILKLKLASPEPHLSESIGTANKELREKCHISSNPDLGGWSFLQALSNNSQSHKESSYVPPLMKRSSSKFSEKSLELCTENLGSETGTDITERGFFSFSSTDLESRKSPTREQIKSRQYMGSRNVNSRNFPPPLTTIREVAIEEREEDDEFENEASDDDEEEEEEEEEEEDEELEQEENDEDVDGNSFNGGLKMGTEKFQTPSRCKEGGHGNEGLCNWEPFWVATS